MASSFSIDPAGLMTNLLGTEEMVGRRILAYRDAGITSLRVEPEGETLGERLQTLGRVVEFVRAIGAGSASPPARR